MTLTRPDKGWAWVVMMASFGSYFLTGGVLHSTGVVNLSLLSRFKESHAMTSVASGLYMCCMLLSGIFASVIINYFSCRISFICGSVMAAVGFLACVFLPTLDGVIIAYGLIAGSGAGICFTTQFVSVALNFVEHRNLAAGIAASGASFGGFILTQPIQKAWNKYGDEGYFFILSGIMLNVSVCGSLVFPSYLEEHSKFSKTREQKNTSSKPQNCSNVFEVFKIPSFVCLCLSLFFAHLGIGVMFICLPSYSVSTNHSASEAAFLFAICGLCGAISRLLTGLSANVDEIDELIIYCGTFLILGISTILLPFYGNTYPGQLAYSAILGLYSGCCYVLLNTLTVKSLGLPNVAVGIGVEMVFSGVGSALGSPLAGYIVDQSGNYELVFAFTGTGIILGSVFGFANEIFRMKRQRFEKQSKDDTKRLYFSVDMEIAVEQSLLFC